MKRYVDEYERTESEECKRCKGGCGYIGIAGVFACEGFRPMTNADKIRSMTDEELAEFIRSQIIARNIGLPVEAWLDWLKKECE